MLKDPGRAEEGPAGGARDGRAAAPAHQDDPAGQVCAHMAALRRVLDDCHPDLAIRGLRPEAAGLMCWVFFGESPELGEVAIRVPRRPSVPGDHGHTFPTADLLRQEAVLSAHVRAYGVPAPEVIRLSDDPSFPFLVTGYARHDGSQLPARELGALAATLHSLPTPAIKPAEQAGLMADEVVVRRLLRHAGSIERLSGVEFRVEPDQLWSCFTDWVPQRVILHMDLRSVNLLCREGRLAALVDWGALLIGDSALELGRLAEYGSRTAEFMAGYATVAAPREVPDAVEALYRLDGAVMLAAVHAEYGLDPAAGRRHLLHALEIRRWFLERASSA